MPPKVKCSVCGIDKIITSIVKRPVCSERCQLKRNLHWLAVGSPDGIGPTDATLKWLTFSMLEDLSAAKD